MSLDRSNMVKLGHFSGNSQVYSANPNGLADIVRRQLVREAQPIAAAVDTTEFVADNSGAVSQASFTGDATGGTVENQLSMTRGRIGVPTGHPVVLRGADLPLNLIAGTTYYVIRVKVNGVTSETIFQVASTPLNADLGDAFAIADDGTGTDMRVELALVSEAMPAEVDLLGLNTGVLDTQAKITADTVIQACADLIAKVNPIRTSIGLDAIDDGGMTPATTIGAIDVTTDVGADDTSALHSDMVVIYDEVNLALSLTVGALNDIHLATGHGSLITSFSRRLDEGAGVTAGFAAATAATSPVGSAATTVLAADWNAVMLAWRDAIGTLIEAVSAAAATAGNGDVAASYIPETEWAAAPPAMTHVAG